MRLYNFRFDLTRGGGTRVIGVVTVIFAMLGCSAEVGCLDEIDVG